MLGANRGGQDIAQEAFVRLYRKGSSAIPAPEARFWIYLVARNLALNELKRRSVRNRIAADLRTLAASNYRNPEQDYEEAERRQILVRLLELLPEQQRAALLLREQQQMSYAEIARVLDVSESKVKVDIHRGFAEKFYLEKYYAPR